MAQKLPYKAENEPKWPKMAQNGQKWTWMAQKWTKMAKNNPKWPKMTQNGPKWPKCDPKWPKMTQKWPKMIQNGPKLTQNYSKWPKNDARICALFPQFFLTEKTVPQTFSLLECVLPWSQYLITVPALSKLPPTVRASPGTNLTLSCRFSDHQDHHNYKCNHHNFKNAIFNK